MVAYIPTGCLGFQPSTVWKTSGIDGKIGEVLIFYWFDSYIITVGKKPVLFWPECFISITSQRIHGHLGVPKNFQPLGNPNCSFFFSLCFFFLTQTGRQCMIIYLGLTLHEQCNGCSGGCLVIFFGRMKSPIIEKTPVMNQQVFHGMVFSFVFFSHLKLESGEIAHPNCYCRHFGSPWFLATTFGSYCLDLPHIYICCVFLGIPWEYLLLPREFSCFFFLSLSLSLSLCFQNSRIFFCKCITGSTRTGCFSTSCSEPTPAFQNG